jgi:membrane protein implicated in regulation of membrane protease activity
VHGHEVDDEDERLVGPDDAARTLASALLLVEVALPTFGLAGVSGLGLAGAGAVALARQDEPWWPLVLVALAVCLWAVQLARRSAPPRTQLVAAGLYATGGVGYGIGARDAAAVVVAALAAVGLALAYPPLLAATKRLLEGPAQVGMEALVGRTAVVERAAGHSGTVRLDGSLWNACTASGELPPPGKAVLVDGYDGMMLRVTPVPVRH